MSHLLLTEKSKLQVNGQDLFQFYLYFKFLICPENVLGYSLSSDVFVSYIIFIYGIPSIYMLDYKINHIFLPTKASCPGLGHKRERTWVQKA